MNENDSSENLREAIDILADAMVSIAHGTVRMIGTYHADRLWTQMEEVKALIRREPIDE